MRENANYLPEKKLIKILQQNSVAVFGGRIYEEQFDFFKNIIKLAADKHRLKVITGGLSIDATVMLEASRIIKAKAIGILAWEDLESYSELVNDNDFSHIFLANNLGHQLDLLCKTNVAIVFPGGLSTAMEWMYWINIWKRQKINNGEKVEYKPIIFISSFWQDILQKFVVDGMIAKRYVQRYAYFVESVDDVDNVLSKILI